MEICSIASGSSGNCICAGTQNCHLMIDAGISGKRIEAGLNSVGLKTAEMEGILITHEHSDHISGLGVIARRYGLPIYGTKGTLEAIANTPSVFVPCLRAGYGYYDWRDRSASGTHFARCGRPGCLYFKK